MWVRQRARTRDQQRRTNGTNEDMLARQFARIEGSNWTPEEVITRFGRPTNVQASGTTRTYWRYRFKNGLGYVEFANGKATWGYVCDRERQTGVVDVAEELLPPTTDRP